MNRRRFENYPKTRGFRPFFDDGKSNPAVEDGNLPRAFAREEWKIHFDERETKRDWFAAPLETETARRLFEADLDKIALKRITIIGSGASGTLLAVNLLRAAQNQPLEINLVEKRKKIGAGAAYDSSSDCHLLNIPAENMSAFPSDAGHFSRWLAAKCHPYAATDFVPRRIYGDYLRDVLADAILQKSSSVKINIVDDEAIDLISDDEGSVVLLKSGEALFSHKVVLALGSFAPPEPPLAELSFTGAEKYFGDPRQTGIFEKIRPEDSVLIIGTGLSMVDVVLNFHQNAHRGKIFAISTHGLLPAAHRRAQSFPPFNGEITSQSRIAGILKTVRERIRENEANGGDWRAVVDALRPVTQQAWMNLDEAEKRRFMRHLRRFWNVSRHRMPAACASVLDEMRRSKQLHLKKGRLQEIKVTDEQTFAVSFLNDGLKNKLSVDAVVNCTGAETDFQKIDLPLVRNLLDEGLISADALHLGVKALPDGRTLNKFGGVSNKLFAIGSVLKGVLWESTAIPEIRKQASELAADLLD